jgi:hypothetical protein
MSLSVLGTVLLQLRERRSTVLTRPCSYVVLLYGTQERPATVYEVKLLWYFLNMSRGLPVDGDGMMNCISAIFK